MALIFATLLSVAASLGSQTEPQPTDSRPYDFQGSQLGQPLQDWMDAHPKSKCGKGKLLWETVCSGDKPSFITTYGGVTYHFYAPDTSKPPLLYEVSIIASRNDRAAILQGLQGKWGSPTATDGVITSWHRGGSTIRYYDLGNGVSVTMQLDSHAEAFSKAVKAEASRAF